jgi:hypothetical protein
MIPKMGSVGEIWEDATSAARIEWVLRGGKCGLSIYVRLFELSCPCVGASRYIDLCAASRCGWRSEK